MKVVIVDDDPRNLALMQSMIERKGHTVLSYLNPQDCPLYQAAPCPCMVAAPCPDVVLADYNMPGVDGMEFLEGIRGRGCQCIHIALVTGKCLDHDDLSRMARNGTRFFLKPVDFPQLYDWLDWVELSSREDT